MKKHSAIAALIVLLSPSPYFSRAAEPQPPFDIPIATEPLKRQGDVLPLSYAPILKEAKSAVVAVYTAKIVRVVQRSGGPRSLEEEFLRRFFGLPTPPQRTPREDDIQERKLPEGIGSGVIVSSDGYILTNNHVVTDERGEDADEILVQLVDGRELAAKIVGRDPRSDIAVLKVDTEDLPTVPIADSDNLAVGDIVFAIGNPLGVGLTVTQGIVSALGRAIGIYGREGYENFIQTDASINPGNSGGGLIDAQGRLVGINSAILSRTGNSIGIGFAIPSNLAVNIARSLINLGEVRRGFLGVNISDLTPDIAEAFKLENTDGVLIDRVEKDYPAYKAGIQRGDIIVAIDGRPIRNANELRLRVSQTPPGRKIEITFIRNGLRQNVTTTVVDPKGSLSALGNELFEGVAVALLSEELRDRYGISDKVEGLAITRVEPASPLRRLLREGMVIIEINDHRATSTQEAREALRRGANKLYIYERGRLGYLAIRLP